MAAMTRLRRGRVVASIANMNCFGAVLKADEERVFSRKHRLTSKGGSLWMRVGGFEG